MSVAPAEKAIFPLDKQLGISNSVYSHDLAQQMVWLSGLLPYAQCEQVFERIGGRMLPASSIWRQTQQHGERMQRQVERAREQVSVERVVLPAVRYDHDQRKGVSLDGGMVNIRGEGWRELKVGAVFDIQLKWQRHAQSGELEEMPYGERVHYTATLGSKDAFTPALWALAVERDVPTAKERAVVGDGALWVWNVAENVCPDACQIVDWFHAVQHLSDAANVLYPQEKDAQVRAQWLSTYQDHLYMGRVHQIITLFHRCGHADLALYFERHQRRMQYLEFREQGFPIGSGTVESGVKQFKQRLTGSGMRWNAHNADRMLTIRAAALSNSFDALWSAAA
jgi:hypothetical protein